VTSSLTAMPGIQLYCRTCWFPSTKPNFQLSGEGVCQACSFANARVGLSEVEWRTKEQQFSKLISEAINVHSPHFDVVVPVSGGKDSITQVVRSNQHDARILAVSVDYGIKTEIGRANLDVIPAIGNNVHLQVYRPPLGLHRQLIKTGLTSFGDPDLFSHTLLHAYPLHQALALQVPLVVLGENSADIYGGSLDLAGLNGMTRSWFEKYAVSGDHSVQATARNYNINPAQLRYYDFPDALETSGTKTVFMSSYFPWDSAEHFEIAKTQGFSDLDDAREGTFKSYVGIDEHINRIHQYLKLLKFGYGRATDHACEEIRLGRMTRSEAKEIIITHELAPPSIEAMVAVSDFLDIEISELAETIERWRNPAIWRRVDDNVCEIPGFVEDSSSPPVTLLTRVFK